MRDNSVPVMDRRGVWGSERTGRLYIFQLKQLLKHFCMIANLILTCGNGCVHCYISIYPYILNRNAYFYCIHISLMLYHHLTWFFLWEKSLMLFLCKSKQLWGSINQISAYNLYQAFFFYIQDVKKNFAYIHILSAPIGWTFSVLQ